MTSISLLQGNYEISSIKMEQRYIFPQTYCNGEFRLTIFVQKIYTEFMHLVILFNH